jgi:hypothetical protein
MRIVELWIEMPQKDRRRAKFKGFWPLLLLVLLIAYERKRPVVAAAAPTPIAAPAPQPTQVAATLTPRMPPPLPVELRPNPTTVPVRPAVKPASANPTLVPTLAGVLTPSPAALVFDSNLVRGSQSTQTSTQKDANGAVITRSESTSSSESEVVIIPRSVSISNTGNAPVKIGQAALAATGFKVSGDSCSGNTLAPQAVCVIVVEFRAKDAGSYAGELSVPSDAAPVTIPVSAAVRVSAPAAK